MNQPGPVPARPQRELRNFRIEKILDHTSQIRELILVGEKEFVFQSGQFITLHIPQTDGKAALRAYSIASDERDHRKLNLIFKYVPNGVASTFVWKSKAGEDLQLSGPFGRVCFVEPPPQQVIFLNTGTGLTQHLSFLLSKSEIYPNVRYRMLFGLRNESEIYHSDVLKTIASRLKDFKFEFVLAEPSPSWSGKKGFVQHHILEFEYTKTPSIFYLCGNRQMIIDTKQLLIEKDNFDAKNIITEAFN